MDAASLPSLLIIIALTTMALGTLRDILGARPKDTDASDLRLECLRLQVENESLKRENAALVREVSYWRYEIHSGRQDEGGSHLSVSVGGDVAGRDKTEGSK